MNGLDRQRTQSYNEVTRQSDFSKNRMTCLSSVPFEGRYAGLQAREMDETRSYLKEILGLSVQTNMRAAPPTVSPVDTISTVMDLMTKENVGSVVIVDNSQPVGIITEKDVLQKVIRLARSLELTLAGDVMSKPLVTIDADRTIADALETLQRHNQKTGHFERGRLSGSYNGKKAAGRRSG